jgi:hypothetical protein
MNRPRDEAKERASSQSGAESTGATMTLALCSPVSRPFGLLVGDAFIPAVLATLVTAEPGGP